MDCVTGKFIIMNKIIRLVNLVCLFILVLFSMPAPAQDLKKISVLPFEIYSKGDKVAIQELLYQKIYSELNRDKRLHIIPADHFLRRGEKIDERRAVEAGKSLKVDFVVMGSLTQLGESFSADVKIIDIKSADVFPPIFVQARGWENLGEIAVQLKTEMLARLGLVEKIVKIEIEGNNKIESSAITQRIKSKEGNPFNEEDITSDIKTIFKMGFFLDVSASAASTPEGKVVTFTVVERGLITDIQIKGNKALDKEDIMEVLTIKTRENLNQEKIKSDIEKIKSLYDTKGYYNAEITDTIERDGEKDFRVIFNVTENDRVYIKSITFEGNEAFASKELKNMMTSSERRFWSFITDDGVLNRDQLKQDVGKINSYYFNNGFINAQVAEPQVTYDKKWLYITIQIKEGKRFKFGKIDISGDSLQRPRGDLFASLKVKEGNDYNREGVVKDIDFLIQACNDEGYAYADVTPSIDINEEEQSVNVDYQIIKGGLVFINRIAISGNTVTRDKVIRRQLAIVEGDLYSSSKVKNSYANLNRLRYFEEVDFQTEKSPEKDKMNINIRVKEKNTGMFMIGAGYSAQERAIVMAQISQNNFLGYGQILNLKASLGSTTNNYELSFIEPWLFDIPLWTKADVWKYRQEYDSYNLDTYGGGLTFGYPIWEKVVGYAGYNLTSYDVRDISTTAPQAIRDQEGERIKSAVVFSLVRDSTDDNVFPTRGVKASASVECAGLGGNVKLIKYSAGAHFYYPLFWDLVFVTKGRIGYIQNLDDDAGRIPIYERYVLGGLNTIRGLRYVGPTNGGTSDVVGGTTMMVFNVELVFPLIKNAGMKGVVFYDAGNAWNYSGAYSFDDLRQSVGAGVRWYSPIGPLRLEYGYVVDKTGLLDDSKGRWEFTIGMFM